jgi:hypothetical protein
MESNPSIELNEDTQVVASSHQSSCDLVEETVVLNLASGVYYGLNSVGTRIWELLQKQTTVGDIRDVLVGEFEVTAEQCLDDLRRVLQELIAEGLVEVQGGGTP